MYVTTLSYENAATHSADPRPLHRGSNDHYATINPRDVFLLYTKTEKTSSTVATSLIEKAYKRNMIPISHGPNGTTMEIFPRSRASLTHRVFSRNLVEEIERITGKSVLLVVSIREGNDWLKSYIAKAETETMTVRDPICEGGKGKHTCDRFLPPKSTERMKWALRDYSKYLPVRLTGNACDYEMTYIPWFVIRHKYVVADSCDLLKRLGMKCNRSDILRQCSRKEVGLDDCEFTPNATVINAVNRINDMVSARIAETVFPSLSLRARNVISKSHFKSDKYVRNMDFMGNINWRKIHIRNQEI